MGIVTLKEVTRTNPINYLGWDAFAGSTQSITDRTGGAFTTGILNKKDKIPKFFRLFTKLVAGLDMNISNDLSSFVSTNSALDVPFGTPENQKFVQPITGLSVTSSNGYIAQEKFSNANINYYNLNHTDFTARNAKWIYNEMESISNNCLTTNNLEECYPFTIEEVSVQCMGIKTYKLSNLPVGAAVTWSVTSPSNVAVLQQTGNAATVYCPTGIQFFLTASFNNYCSTATSSTKGFTYVNDNATEQVTLSDLSGSTVWCPNDVHTLSVTNSSTFGGLATYNWVLPANFSIVSTTTNTANIDVVYNGGSTTTPIIKCNAVSYCTNPTEGQLEVPAGDLLVKLIKSQYTSYVPLQTSNTVNDNNATVSISLPNMLNTGTTYTLNGGFPDVYGTYANDKKLLFVYNASGGTFNFTATTTNAPTCNVTVTTPFSVTLNPSSYTYNPIFRVAPNPFTTQTVVSVNMNNASNSILQACLGGGGFIRVTVFNSTTGAQVYLQNGAIGSTSVNVSTTSFPSGFYYFKINAINCPNGYYEENKLVQKL